MDSRREIISSVAVAVDRDKNSRFALKYALEKCSISPDEVIKLVHVKLRFADSDDAVTHPSMSANASDSFIPFRCFCVCKRMQSEMVVLEDYDVAAALVEYVRRCHIQALFLGGPSRGGFSRLFKKVDIPRMVMKLAPSFCNVYIIGKGDLTSARPATMWITPPIFTAHQSQLQLRQDRPHPPPEQSGTSHDEVEDDLSVSSGRLSTESDFLSFYENFETGGKLLPMLDTDVRQDISGECEASSSPRLFVIPTTTPRGYEGT